MSAFTAPTRKTMRSPSVDSGYGSGKEASPSPDLKLKLRYYLLQKGIDPVAADRPNGRALIKIVESGDLVWFDTKPRPTNFARGPLSIKKARPPVPLFSR